MTTEIGMSVIDEIAAERKRQIEGEGYDAAHDDAQEDGQIAMAAVCYIAPDLVYLKDERANATIYRDPWPWEKRFDKRLYNGNIIKPNDLCSTMKRRELLVKAGALLVAEIERLDRAASQ